MREIMDFRLPELGEGVYEAEVVSWLVKPGDKVKRGQGLVEVLTDKAVMEVPAPFVGVVTGLQATPGQKLKVGDVILAYDAVDGAAGNTAPRSEGETPAKLAPADAKVQGAMPAQPPGPVAVAPAAV